MEKTGCKIICGAPTTLAVKGLMMMMMIIDKSTEWSTIPACPRLMCFFLTGAIAKGLILQNFVSDVCVCFVICKFVSGLILWGLFVVVVVLFFFICFCFLFFFGGGIFGLMTCTTSE